MSDLRGDLRFALRQLRKSPGFAVAAIVTLALGIGANTAMFTIIDSVLLRPLPYRAADRLMFIGEGTDPQNLQATSPLNMEDLRRPGIYEQLGGYVIDVAILQTGQGGETVVGTKVTADMFPVLGAKPRLGRTFSAADCEPGAAPTVVLSEGAWRSKFNADPSIIGKPVRIGSVPRIVIGVMPATFTFPDEGGQDVKKGLWLPFQPTVEMRTQRGFSLLSLIGRLPNGATPKQAAAKMAVVAANIKRTDPKGAEDRHFTLRPYQERVTGAVRPVLIALMSALGLVLLIACTNVANLQLSRHLGRYQELAVRCALGASRVQLVVQVLIEGAVLSFLGATAGLGLAQLMLKAVQSIPGDLIPRSGEVHLRLSVIAILAGFALIATLLASLIPAVFAIRTEPQTVLRGAGRGVSPQAARSRMAGWLVIGEVAIAAIFLVACALLFRTLYNLEHAHLGFDTENVITFMATPPTSAGFLSGNQNGSAQPPIARTLYTPILEQLRVLPGVKYAALASSIPFDGVDLHSSFDVNGHENKTEEERKRNHSLVRVMSGGYLEAMGTRIVRGRGISNDDAEQTPFVAVINQSFARQILRGDPIGQSLNLGGKETGMPKSYTIVGVVEDAVQASTSQPVVPELILPYRQIPEDSLFYPIFISSATNYILRTSGNLDLGGEIHRILQKAAPGFAIDSLQTMRKTVDHANFNQRLAFYLIAGFGGLALLMVAIGLYGVLSQLVGQRRQEIGVRMALGATRELIVWMVLRRALILMATGLVIGTVAAFAMKSLVASFLYGVTGTDVLSYLGALAGLLAVGVVAALLPAGRAAAGNPLEALRAE